MENIFDQPIKMIEEHMITSETLQQVNEMISQPAFNCIMFISKLIMR